MVMIALSAFLASAAFAPIGIWYLGVVGYSLFFRKISKSHRQLWHAFVFGFIYNAIVLHWSGKFVGAVPWLLLSFLQALFYLPVGAIAKRWGSIWLTIGALLLMEEIRSIFPFGGFGWTRIAFSQIESPASAILPYGGVLALSALTLLLASLISKIRIGNLAKLTLIIIGLALIPGNPQGSGSVRLLAIQGNTPSVGLEFNSRAQAVFNLHRDATYKYATGSYDAIIWPENAVDIDPSFYPSVAADIENLTSDKQAPLIAGVVLKRDGSPVNASVLYNSDSGAVSTYIKRGLTPFGEYMPLRGLAEVISPFAATVVDFKPGNELVTHEVAGAALGPIICYEIINDRLVAEMSLNSDALIVQTNSATFAGTAESRQQLAITRIRALENSRMAKLLKQHQKIFKLR
jgi:apolipoprotein N-acyltransferase